MACEMRSDMLSNLAWTSRLIVSCFPCFTVKDLENFRMEIIERERTTLKQPKVEPTGRPTLLENARIELLPAIVDNVIRPLSSVPMILLNRFLFLACRVGSSVSSSKYASISVIFLTGRPEVLLVL